MSKRKAKYSRGAMLELWRPPPGAGDPVGCLATTYTFHAGLFDEQCLARFLEIESEPNREDLAFLLERECRLGSVYAGVLVDHSQAGVEHSLRWDVLPVRIRSGKQHAKLSVLAWTHHVRIVVASANLTDAGYRDNQEVAAAIDLTPSSADLSAFSQSLTFLRGLLALVPGHEAESPAVRRASVFLDQIEQQTQKWKAAGRGATIRQELVFTLPAVGDDPARSSLEEAIQVCRKRGGSPHEAWVASPFFDLDEVTNRVSTALSKRMAVGRHRKLVFCVPIVSSDNDTTVPRLVAPKSLLSTPSSFQGSVNIHALPNFDEDKNRREWHAKMLLLYGEQYAALVIGSANFTCAGMGIGPNRNAEANLVSVVDRVSFGREVGQLEAVWPHTVPVDDPEAAEWLGRQEDQEDSDEQVALPLPAGFLSANYRAGNARQIVLQLDPDQLPDVWSIGTFSGQEEQPLITAEAWHEDGRRAVIELAWLPIQPPDKLHVHWADGHGYMPLNVEDGRELPPPASLDQMSADDMLLVLAAADPSAAFRAWVINRQPSELFDADLDAATPVDLDPLRRYDLQATFLHRIRRRSRILMQLRAYLERPVWGQQALEWRLRGIIGVEPLARRLVHEFVLANGAVEEALLTLADFLIVLAEVEYQPGDGTLPKLAFDKIYRPFLRELAGTLQQQVDVHRGRVAPELMSFWERVLQQCQK